VVSALGAAGISVSARLRRRKELARTLQKTATFAVLGLLAFAVRLLVGRADEAAFDEHMSAFLDVSENSLRHPRGAARCVGGFVTTHKR